MKTLAAPTAIRWWHCFFGHHWTKWVTQKATAEKTYLGTTKRYETDVIVQRRQCTLCGREQITLQELG